jgi:DNA polymerase-4
MEKLKAITPQVEQISIDEAFMDVTDIEGEAEGIGRALQKEIQKELNLPNSLGIASNKLIAKTATDVGKKRGPKGIAPNAITVVPPGEEAAFLAPLEVRMLWGVGPKTAEKLLEIGIRTIGELAAIKQVELMRRFGMMGFDLSQRARGIDTRPVITEHEAKSISKEVTYSRDIDSEETLLDTLNRQSHHLASQLARQGLTARTVKIKLRWPNFDTLTRQKSLTSPTDHKDVIYNAAKSLFYSIWQSGKRVRLLGTGVSGLDIPSRQLELWDPEWQKEEKIQDLLAEVKERYGGEYLKRGFGRISDQGSNDEG